MSLIDVDLTGKDISISGVNYGKTRIEITNVDINEFIDNVSAEDCINHFSDAKIMDIIGLDRFMEYFGVE